MDMVLLRMQYRADGIFGELRDLNDVLVAYTLEHGYTDGACGFYPKIPPGVYTCRRGIHRLEGMQHPFETFEVTNVPGHTNCLIHWGNWSKDFDGCIGVGEAVAQSAQGQMITNSKATFDEFMRIQLNEDQFQLTILA